VFPGAVRAADLVIVIDDSSGMCGYLAEPDSEYRRLLHRLQAALQETGVSVDLVRLSHLAGKGSSNGVSIGAEAKRQLDQLQRAVKCPFSLPTSPLHLMHRVAGRKLTLLVSDMIFDLGADGAVRSSSEFIDGLEQWSNTTRSHGLDDYFKASTGLIGFRSTFRGVYFTQQGTKQIEFKSVLQRPFYVFWKSVDNEFAARVLRRLADRDMLDNSQAFAFSVAPIVKATTDFSFRRPRYLADLLAGSSPSVVYEFANRKARFDNDGKVAPHECFRPSLSSGSATIAFDKRCGNDSNSRNVAFRGVRDLQTALIVVRADDLGSIRRSVLPRPAGAAQEPVLKYLYVPPRTQLVRDKVQEKDDKGNPTGKELGNFTDANKGCGGEGKLDCWAPRHKALSIAEEGGTFLTIQINRSYGRINSEVASDPKRPIFSGSWLERFDPASEDERVRIVEATIAGWSASKEPEVCGVPQACPQNSQTIGLADFVRALAGRLDSASRSVELLNADSERHPLKVDVLWSAR
jgi:hypothetical protein